jgi:exonuclease III
MAGKLTLKICSWNLCNGLMNKMEIVRDLLYSSNIDVLLLQETEIPVTTEDELLSIAGYQLEMAIATKTIRTVAYLKSDVRYTRHLETMDRNVLMFELDDKYSVKQLSGIYRPFKLIDCPNRLEAFKGQIKTITDFIRDEKSAIIMGDFNLDYRKKDLQNYPQRRIYDELLEAVTAFDLTQMVKEDTWLRVYQGTPRSSILDHVYTNNQEIIDNLSVDKQVISDHSSITITLTGRMREEKKNYFTYTCWKGYSVENVKKELQKYDFRPLARKPANVIADHLDQVLGTVRDTLLKVKTSVKKSTEQQYSQNVIAMKGKLKNMFKRAKKTKNVSLLARCKLFEKQIRGEIIRIKKTKVRAEANLGGNNLWKAVRIATDKPQKNIPETIEGDDGKHSNDSSQASAFAEFFSNKINNLKNDVAVDDEVYNGTRKIFGIYDDDWITEELVSKVIDDLKAKRSQGYDRCPVVMLKDGKQELLTIITILMRKVIINGAVPEQWKIAKVIPLHKKGSTKKVENYRPISNLSAITKIFERLLLWRFRYIEQEENCDITGSAQHGFKKNRGTETACLEIQSRIAQECDLGNYVSMSSLDLSAAFDVVDHELLKKRMLVMGFPSQIVATISDWLKDRYFYCEVNGKNSRLMELNCGTVQGSILGPVLFAIYISPLEDIVEGLVTYADDNYNISSGATEELSLSGCVRESEKMITWMNKSGLCINTSKTEICTFHDKDVRIKEIELNGATLVVKSEIKVLGLIFDTKLNWTQQVGKAITNANKAKQAIKIISRYFNSEELLKLATAYFYSRLYYGAKVWLISTLNGCLKKKIWQASSRMLIVITKNFEVAHSYMELHRKYLRATPEMWSNYSTACAMYNLICKQTPDCIVPISMSNVLHSSRQRNFTFTRSNSKKIGFNCLSNRLQLVSRRINFSWQEMSFETFKCACKKVFINEPLED